MQGFLELRIDEEANCHPGKSLESGNRAPVVGELGGLIPRVNPTVLTSTNVANDPIEEELRLPVSMVPTSIHFCHHKAAKCRLGIVS